MLLNRHDLRVPILLLFQSASSKRVSGNFIIDRYSPKFQSVLSYSNQKIYCRILAFLNVHPVSAYFLESLSQLT
jgi:hypothetical protein